jgi:putative lipase involved disintegration of autophagic bodies
MRKKLIPAILEQVARCGPFDTLLFTGHSAGGALAQLFYALSLTDSDPMAVLAQRKFAKAIDK